MVDKEFDCVEMKQSTQRSLLEQYKGLSEKKIRDKRMSWLNNSDHSLAKWWRNQSKKTEAA